MKTEVATFLTLAVLSLSSCKHFKKPADIVFDEDAQSTLDIPSYTRNALDGWPEGRKLEPDDSSRVRHAEGLHAYHVGRLPSKDRREMHEAHTVYRVEQNSRWDQRLPSTPMQSSGVVFGIREPSYNPVPKDQVITNEQARQLSLSQNMEQQLTLLKEQQSKLEGYLASAPDKNKTIEELQKQKAKTEGDLQSLQAQTEQLKRELQDYKDREAIRAATSKTTKTKP
jgi:hypothetical protein